MGHLPNTKLKKKKKKRKETNPISGLDSQTRTRLKKKTRKKHTLGQVLQTRKRITNED